MAVVDTKKLMPVKTAFKLTIEHVSRVIKINVLDFRGVVNADGI